MFGIHECRSRIHIVSDIIALAPLFSGKLNMTIGIAAITDDAKYIIVAGDRMLSHGDIIQAADDAALKARRVAKKWGITFAGDSAKFMPILGRTFRHLQSDDFECDYSEKEIRDALLCAYREELEQLTVSCFLGRLGYPTVAEFLQRGLAELGEGYFQGLLRKIESVDLGITILAHGFDGISAPYIFQISNPGIYTSHELLGCAAIGSGLYMATASLRQRPPNGSLETAIYRVLEAKFSSETASGVGRATTLFVQQANGNTFFLSESFIEAVRSFWLEVTRQPISRKIMKFLEEKQIADLVEKFGTDTSGQVESSGTAMTVVE